MSGLSSWSLTDAWSFEIRYSWSQPGRVIHVSWALVNGAVTEIDLAADTLMSNPHNRQWNNIRVWVEMIGMAEFGVNSVRCSVCN